VNQYQSPQSYRAQQQFPRTAKTRRKLGPGETMFHLTLTIMTGGLWGFVWWARVHSKTSVTKFR
jgi:hypothetical protein